MHYGELLTAGNYYKTIINANLGMETAPTIWLKTRRATSERNLGK